MRREMGENPAQSKPHIGSVIPPGGKRTLFPGNSHIIIITICEPATLDVGYATLRIRTKICIELTNNEMHSQ